MGSPRLLVLLVLQLQALCVLAAWQYSNPEKHPRVPRYGPQPGPAYMVDNTKNYYNVAPDKGSQNGPVWKYSGSRTKFVSNLNSGRMMRGGYRNQTAPALTSVNATTAINKRQSGGSFWVKDLASLGVQPRAGGDDYKFFRNVVTDFKADNTGASDTVEAINAAVEDGNRCGEECGNTFSQGAIVYFPPGTYKICSPIIQLYYTQFIGDANDPPTILGCDEFKGIALIDTDPYIPGGNGANWYINQNQFFRQIRNFIFDLREMPSATDDNDQPLVPTGLHWQVSQATSLQNLVFEMPTATNDDKTTAVGIFTENGSGGFVSDLTFNGGNIGWRAGSQQYTAQNLKFNNCLTAVQMVWDWGWVWQGIQISGGSIGFNISGAGGSSGQGIGSISVVDSSIKDVEVGVLTNNKPTSPNIVLDNVDVDGVDRVVQVDGGDTLLTASGTVKMWTTGKVYKGKEGSVVTGTIETPAKGAGLLKDGKLFVRTRPQYESEDSSKFLKATTDGNCKNDGTGDQTRCLNLFLQSAKSAGKIAYFPAGIYQVGGTVLIPTGSVVVGASWSQIQGTGYYFSDMANPKVVVQVGNVGEVGTMEISDMLFTVAGNTAGAILLEWNVAAATQGAAAMWDSHIRVGGAKGTSLDIDSCPKRQFNELCIAASLMMHVTKQASGYFENVWVWAADHDNDMSIYDTPDKLSSQISVYCARGLLIESQGPSWFYGGGSEHSVMYNYLIHGAKDVYLGHIQTETPYYQPEPIAPKPFNVAKAFPGDPDFSGCKGDGACASSWGVIVSDSKSVTVHGAGLYSFFQDYYQDCLDTHDCQQRVLRVIGSEDVVFLNLFTVAISNIAEGADKTLILRDSNQRGFTTEISVWLPLDGSDNINTVFVGTDVWTSSTVTCSDASCLLVFPTSHLQTPAVITPSAYTTSFEYGGMDTVTQGGVPTVVFVTTTTTTVIIVTPITTDGIAYSNYNISSGQSTINLTPSVDIPAWTATLPDGQGSSTTRVIPLPPWPLINDGPTDASTIPLPSGDLPSGSGTYYTGVTSTITASGATVATITFPAAVTPTTVTCPPDELIVFATPATTIYTECRTPTTIAIGFNCPTTKVVSFLGPTTAVVSVDCSVVTGFPSSDPTSGPNPDDPPPTTTTTTPVLPVWTTWPPGIIAPIETKPCNLWFFFVCIDRDDLHIGGWFWSFPPGIYPPGPPPPGIRWPPGFSLSGSLPPWPRITIGPNGELTNDPEPTECSTTLTASICTASTVITVTSDSTTTKTIGTSTGRPECETISGCSVSQSMTDVTSTTIETCTAQATGARLAARPSASPLNGQAGSNRTIIGRKVAAALDDEHSRHSYPLQKRACKDVPAVIYPSNPRSRAEVGLILAKLDGQTFREVRSDSLGGGYTAFIWVASLPADIQQEILEVAPQAFVYDYQNYNKNNLPPIGPQFGLRDRDQPAVLRRGLEPDPNLELDTSWGDATLPGNATEGARPLWKRAATSATANDVYRWNAALVSFPKAPRPPAPKPVWKVGPKGGAVSRTQFIYYYDDSAGAGRTVYAVGEPGGVNAAHEEWSGQAQPRAMTKFEYGGGAGEGDMTHGTQVASVMSGKELGICKRCGVVYTGFVPGAPADVPNDPYRKYDTDPRDWVLEDLLTAWDDMNRDGRTPATSVINLSWGSQYNFWTPAFIKRLYEVLKLMDRAGVTMVAAAGNWAYDSGGVRPNVDTYPQLFADPNNALRSQYQDASDPQDQGYLPNLIVVGATDQYGKRGRFSQTADFVTTYAGGVDFQGTGPGGAGYDLIKGTSFAAPQVAALAGYFKGLPSRWQAELNQGNSDGPKAVKAMIRALQRDINSKITVRPPTEKFQLVWNGMSGTDFNCLVNPPQGDDADGTCPDLPDRIGDYTPPPACGRVAAFAGTGAGFGSGLLPEFMAMGGEGNSTNGTAIRMMAMAKRQSGGSCTLPGEGSGGQQISVTTGPTAGPTCAAGPDGCGGHVCSGYWCAPTPTGLPPGFQDPKDPSSTGFSATPTTISGPSTSTTTSAPPPEQTPITPLERGPIRCFDEADFPGHADIASGSQNSYATSFSGLRDNDSMGPDSAPITMRKTDKHGVNYDFSCSWVPGCKTTVDRQSFGFPLGSPSQITAYLLVREDYTKCNNGGVGGTCQVGCLLYKFEGARGDVETDPCDGFNCQQCGSPFEPAQCQTCCRGLTREKFVPIWSPATG
ncbi:glycan 1-3-beta-glucosidase precursor [Apiospora saccharicola]|uniref:Glycan 1-3-beta-glucosidase n=1 Tax=Apiospora saccharicola TaxID=335842 RepID=A0ABR1VB82_9PEZI